MWFYWLPLKIKGWFSCEDSLYLSLSRIQLTLTVSVLIKSHIYVFLFIKVLWFYLFFIIFIINKHLLCNTLCPFGTIYFAYNLKQLCYYLTESSHQSIFVYLAVTSFLLGSGLIKSHPHFLTYGFPLSDWKKFCIEMNLKYKNYKVI